MPTVTHLNSNAGVAGTSGTPNFPYSTPQSGARMLLVAGGKPTSDNGGSMTNPSGWTTVSPLDVWPDAGSSDTGGYGATAPGVDVGNMNFRVIEKGSTGSESGSLTVNVGTMNVHTWGMSTFVSSTGRWETTKGAWVACQASGDVATATITPPVELLTGDMLVFGHITPTDASATCTRVLTRSGMTATSSGDLHTVVTASNNDAAHYTGYYQVDSPGSGDLTATFTYAAATGTNQRGPAFLVILRAAPVVTRMDYRRRSMSQAANVRSRL